MAKARLMLVKDEHITGDTMHPMCNRQRALLVHISMAIAICFLLATTFAPLRAEPNHDPTRDPQTPSREMAAVEKARLSGDRELEMKLLEPLLQTQEPDNPVAHFYHATLLRDKHRYDDARRECQRTLELAPSDHWVAQSARTLLNDLKDPPPITTSLSKGGRIGYIGLYFHNRKILQILPGSPAETAHLAVGDTILTVDGTPVTGLADAPLSKRMRGLVGPPIKLVILRNGKQYACTIIRGQSLHETDHGPTEIQAVPALTK